MKTHVTYSRIGKFFFVVVSLLLVGQPIATQACSTPVYRYAMYNWPSAPYRVFYFHRGEPSEKSQTAETQRINERLDKLIEGQGKDAAPANILLHDVDLAETGLDKLPSAVKEAFEKHEDGEPSHLVFTPWGVNIFSGQLDEAAFKTLVNSPVRTRIAKLLEEGNVAVMLFVPGKEKKENARVQKALKDLIARAAAGEIPTDAILAMPEPTKPEGKGKGDDDEPEVNPAAIQLATVTVKRSDPAESWLVRSLTTIEPDLAELADEPMVYAVYGRGRALEPYVGKGITPNNLTEVIMFLGSSCSCTVKEMNPGADLLFQWDWDATAEILAADDPSLDMSPYGYQEYPATPPAKPSGQ